ncbi:MAG: FKBP-type peptidyl-prolyl cis-trans isomerase [Sphingomonadaceae bacterium]
MSDVTAVPLRPIKKGAITRLWLGVAAACAVAGGLAFAGTSAVKGKGCSAAHFGKGSKPVSMTSGLMIQTVKAGAGAKPTDTDVVLIDYKGSLTDGKVFDQNQRTPLEVAGVVPGFSEALKAMQTGGQYKICIPAELGYGAQEAGTIPPNSTLLFDVTLIDFKSVAEIQAAQALMQQQQAQGQMPGGATAPVPPPQR